MKKPRRALLLMGFAFVLSLFVFTQGSINAEDALFIKITSTCAPEKALNLDPEAASIAKGTIVYWVNLASEEVQVVFQEGKKCEDVTEDPSRFKPDWEACYITDYLGRYDTSRLKFSEAGTLGYTIKTESGLVVEGKIIVK